MLPRTPVSWANVVLGAITLYVGWGEAFPLITPGDQLCLLQSPPRGLHLDEVGMLVYTECQYTYEFAWPVFLLLSLAAITFVLNGARLSRPPRERIDEER